MSEGAATKDRWDSLSPQKASATMKNTFFFFHPPPLIHNFYVIFNLFPRFYKLCPPTSISWSVGNPSCLADGKDKLVLLMRPSTRRDRFFGVVDPEVSPGKPVLFWWYVADGHNSPKGFIRINSFEDMLADHSWCRRGKESESPSSEGTASWWHSGGILLATIHKRHDRWFLAPNTCQL